MLSPEQSQVLHGDIGDVPLEQPGGLYRVVRELAAILDNGVGRPGNSGNEAEHEPPFVY